MNFLGDYHTHTIYSRKKFIPYYHAKGTIEENILEAKNMGLKELAITDHGFNHAFFGCSRKDLSKTKSEIERLSQKHGIKVYFGVESNFISRDGSIDVIEKDLEYLDIVLCGYHKTAKVKTIKDFFSITLANHLAKYFGSSKKLINRNTEMVLQALEKNKIDILTHLNSKMKCDVEKIAQKASEKGTLIELNEKHCDFTKEEMDKMLKTNVMFIVDSDAHKPQKIGKFKKVESIIENYKIPKDRIVNLGRLPNFLSMNNKDNK